MFKIENLLLFFFGDWLAEPRYSVKYESDKIVIRQTGDSLIASFDNNKFIVRDNLYTIVKIDNDIDIKFILGLLNSNLLNWFYQNIINPEKGEALAQVKRGHISILPIKEINFELEDEITINDKIVSLVDQMITSKKQLSLSKTENEKTYREQKCSSIDNQIDRLVYELYGLTEEEIGVVEEKDE